jgi:serine/threonine protein kinase
MAPEVLSSQVLPASDLWSAGVMAHQLLTGRLPFDDHRNPFAPSISAVWRSVLCDKVRRARPASSCGCMQAARLALYRRSDPKPRHVVVHDKRLLRALACMQ